MLLIFLISVAIHKNVHFKYETYRTYLFGVLCLTFLEVGVELLPSLLMEPLTRSSLEGCMTDCQSSVSSAWHHPPVSLKLQFDTALL